MNCFTFLTILHCERHLYAHLLSMSFHCADTPIITCLSHFHCAHSSSVWVPKWPPGISAPLTILLPIWRCSSWEPILVFLIWIVSIVFHLSNKVLAWIYRIFEIFDVSLTLSSCSQKKVPRICVSTPSTPCSGIHTSVLSAFCALCPM